MGKKSFAELAYINDKSKNEEAISIHATVGASFGELTPMRRGPDEIGLLVRAIPSLFVQLEREGLGDGLAGNKVNNLTFGGALSGFLQPRETVTRTHFYSVNARYITDTEFHSSMWAADLAVTPQIPVPGNIIAYDLVRNRLVLDWLLTGVVDYHHVSDPGDKEELADEPSFFRAGFDFSGSLRFLLDSSREHAISLRGSYQLREAISKSVGDARLLSLGLMLEPSPHYAFGLTFERGRNLDSLEFSKVWKATLGVRQ